MAGIANSTEAKAPSPAGSISSGDYRYRPDGTKKGKGWLGELKRSDGRVSTELSVSYNIDGKEILLPLLVPTLNKKEVDWLLTNEVKPKSIPKSIEDKAISHAMKRIKQNKSPFFD